MSNNVKDKIASLAKILEFHLSDEELTKIENEYHDIEKTLKLVQEINTTNIVPTNFVHDYTQTPPWREDVVEDYESNSVFSNCKDFKNHMVEIKNEK